APWVSQTAQPVLPSALTVTPSPRPSRGRDERSSLLEGWGEGLYPLAPVSIDRPVPPHPKFAIANFDLSPQAGRGDPTPASNSIGAVRSTGCFASRASQICLCRLRQNNTTGKSAKPVQPSR